MGDHGEGHETALVADVDCTAAGQELCSANGVQGYPTLKYGDPSDLQDYKGGRDFGSLNHLPRKTSSLCAVFPILIFATTRKKPKSINIKPWMMQLSQVLSKLKRKN